jgi:hypothetical protein
VAPESWPLVKPLPRRALEMGGQIAREGLVELDTQGRGLRAALAASSVELKEAPKKLANAIKDLEGLEAEHEEVKARHTAEWKKLRA